MPEYLTTSEAAAALDISVRRVQALIKSGQLAATKRGRDWTIPEESLATYTPGKRGRRWPAKETR